MIPKKIIYIICVLTIVFQVRSYSQTDGKFGMLFNEDFENVNSRIFLSYKEDQLSLRSLAWLYDVTISDSMRDLKITLYHVINISDRDNSLETLFLKIYEQSLIEDALNSIKDEDVFDLYSALFQMRGLSDLKNKLKNIEIEIILLDHDDIINYSLMQYQFAILKRVLSLDKENRSFTISSPRTSYFRYFQIKRSKVIKQVYDQMTKKEQRELDSLMFSSRLVGEMGRDAKKANISSLLSRREERIRQLKARKEEILAARERIRKERMKANQIVKEGSKNKSSNNKIKDSLKIANNKEKLASKNEIRIYASITERKFDSLFKQKWRVTDAQNKLTLKMIKEMNFRIDDPNTLVFFIERPFDRYSFKVPKTKKLKRGNVNYTSTARPSREGKSEDIRLNPDFGVSKLKGLESYYKSQFESFLLENYRQILSSKSFNLIKSNKLIIIKCVNGLITGDNRIWENFEIQYELFVQNYDSDNLLITLLLNISGKYVKNGNPKFNPTYDFIQNKGNDFSVDVLNRDVKEYGSNLFELFKSYVIKE
ncbi:hypothetical protein [Winogradskyella sp. 3972H.M.0a.05]|uniref:hypothetical protein n=1 Tax=Winogradskyella sp. 3972H.M.0a.05 TaxID=2950277 RepID=UPI00339729B2